MRSFPACTCLMLLMIPSLIITSVTAMGGTTTFDNGTKGWGVFFSNENGLGDFVQPSGGNPGAHLQWVMIDTFGATLRNETNPDTIGDYSRFAAPVTLGLDIKVGSITVFGSEVQRDLIVELVDYNPPGSDYPYVSVWYELGQISLATTPNWTHFEVTVDPTATALPPGWGGTGAESPTTYEPVLPPDRTFASVLASVDEVRFTTFKPGFFYAFTNFDLHFDNVTVTPIPEPTALAMLGGCTAIVLLRPRRPTRY
jgi:hypothetical protein